MIIKKCKLSDLCDVRDGTHDSPQYIQKGYPLVTSKNIVDGHLDLSVVNYISESDYNHINERSKVDLGDIIMPMIGTIGNPHLVKETPGYAIKNVALIKFHRHDVSNKFVYYFLQSDAFKTYVAENNRGGTQKFLSLKDIRSMEIPALPYKNQLEICVVLDKVTELIALRKEQLAKLDELVKSRFIELFGGINDSKLYPYKTVKGLTEVISGGTPSRDISDYWEGGTIPWVKTTELQNNVITEVEEFITEEGLNNSSAKIVPPGTVLIAMYGQGKTRGMTAYLGIEACTNQACACILPSNKINQTYLWLFFVLSYDHLRDMAKGGNQPNLNGNIIKNYPILYPPREMQEQFASFIEQTDKSKLTIHQSLDKLELLKKSLMQEFFG